MRSGNLKNYIKRHGDGQHATSYQQQPGHKRLSSSSQLPIQSVSPVKNSKIQNLVVEILNDSAIIKDNSRPILPIRQESTREKSNISKAIKNPPVPTPQNLPKKLVPLMVDNENSLEINEDDLKVLNLTKKLQPRAKHDIIGSSNDEDDVDPQSSDEDTENESNSEADDVNNKIVVPDTAEGLRDQFNQLFVEFTRGEKLEHGHEFTVGESGAR